MKKKLLKRRAFVKNSSAATGLALTAGSFTGIFAAPLYQSEKLAMLGGTPVRAKGSSLLAKWPIYDESDVNMYVDAYKNHNWSEHSFDEKELGHQFQRKYAELMGVKYCAVTNAGTNALEAAQRALDIGPGDEVITQTNTFVATAQPTFNLLPCLF